VIIEDGTDLIQVISLKAQWSMPPNTV